MPRVIDILRYIMLLLLAVSVLSTLYITVAPKQGESFTEFYILGLNGSASDYPTSVAVGDESALIVGIINHEYAALNYTLLIRFKNSTLENRTFRIESGQAWEGKVGYSLKDPAQMEKLELLLYKDENYTAPYRELCLRVNVSESRQVERVAQHPQNEE